MARRVKRLAGGLYGISVGNMTALDGRTVALTVTDIPTLDYPTGPVTVDSWTAEFDSTVGSITVRETESKTLVLHLKKGTRLAVELRGITNSSPADALQNILDTPDSDEVRAAAGPPARMYVDTINATTKRPIVLLWTHMNSDISGAMLLAGNASVEEPVPLAIYYQMQARAQANKIGIWNSKCRHCNEPISLAIGAAVHSSATGLVFCSEQCRINNPEYRRAIRG